MCGCGCEEVCEVSVGLWVLGGKCVGVGVVRGMW